MSGETIAAIIVAVIIIAIIWASNSSDKNQMAERHQKECKRLNRQIDAYDKYLTKECGFEKASIGRYADGEFPELDMMEFNHQIGLWEHEHKELGLRGSIRIGWMLYDITDSEDNKLKIENYEISHKLINLEMQEYYARLFMEELRRNHSKILSSVWKELAKKYEIADVIPEYYYLLSGEMGGKEKDIDAMAKRLEKKGTPLTKESIKRLKEGEKLAAKQNKLIENFAEYKEHKWCDDDKCLSGKTLKECKAIKKKFEKYDEDELFMTMD